MHKYPPSVPDLSSPFPHIPLPENPSSYYPPDYTFAFQIVSFLQVAQTKPCIDLSSPIRATCPTHLIILDLITRTILADKYRTSVTILCSIFHSPATTFLLGPNILISTIFSNTSAYVSPSIWVTMFHNHTKKLRGLSPQANYTDRSAAAGRRS